MRLPAATGKVYFNSAANVPSATWAWDWINVPYGSSPRCQLPRRSKPVIKLAWAGWAGVVGALPTVGVGAAPAVSVEAMRGVVGVGVVSGVRKGASAVNWRSMAVNVSRKSGVTVAVLVGAGVDVGGGVTVSVACRVAVALGCGVGVALGLRVEVGKAVRV